MPRKQAVYGKQPRAAFNPASIFAGSPENTKRKTVETVKILADDEIKGRKKQLADEQSVESPVRNRKALGEINGNATLNVDVPAEKDMKKSKKSKTKRRAKVEAIKPAEPERDAVRDAVEDICEPEVESRAQEDATEAPRTVHQVVIPLEEQIEATRLVAQETVPPTPSPEDPPQMAAEAPTPADCYSEHCASLLELTAYPVSSFSEWADEMHDSFSLVKIAEASFGEVYRLSLQPEVADDTSLPLSKNDESVLKVIALTQPPDTLPKNKRDRERALKKAENMSKPADVASELKLLQRLSDIPGFTNFRDLRVLQGRPPGPFAKAFTAFNEAQKAADKELSIFPDPAKKASYSKDQLWAVIEMQDAGTDLEKLVAKGLSSSVWVVWDIFWQVVLALAKGEEEAEFEHRDLHLGNICVRTPELVDEANVDYSKTLGFTSHEATLIDYTVSRANMVPASMACETSGTTDPGDEVAYIDLANDPHLFYGDSAEEYQYDIYRYMRGCIYYDSPYARFPNDGYIDEAEQEAEQEAEEEVEAEGEETSNKTPIANPQQNEDPHSTENTEAPQQDQSLPCPPSLAQMHAIETTTARNWRQFHPLTNLCWLHYVLYTLLEQMTWPSASKLPPKKSKPEQNARAKRARELESALLRVQEVLDPGWLGAGEEGCVGRSGELVAWAVEEGWLRVGDVVGGGGEFEVFGEDEGQGEEEDELVRGLEGLGLESKAAVEEEAVEEEAVEEKEVVGRREKSKSKSRSKSKSSRTKAKRKD